MWHDLTRVIDPALPPYRHGDYADPAVAIRPWATVAQQGFATQAISLGTQTGTHIDAPAHFVDGAATLDALPAAALMGRYRRARGGVVRGEGAILYLDALDAAPMPEADFARLLALRLPVWVMAGAATVAGHDDWHLHRELARAGVFLVEDLDEAAARAITGPGRIVALPLRLAGTSGAPARVLAEPDEA